MYLDADPAEPLHLPLLAVVHPVVAPGVEEHLAVAMEGEIQPRTLFLRLDHHSASCVT